MAKLLSDPAVGCHVLLPISDTAATAFAERGIANDNPRSVLEHSV